MKKFGKKSVALIVGVAALTVTGSALAAVTFDPATGTGFVGKGDVQLVYGWNNAQLQTNAPSVQFRALTTEVSETTWTCKRDTGEQTQERTRTTTTSTQGVVSSIARVKNQITGFNLSGYSGSPTQTTETEGPPLGSCPNFWSVIQGPDTEVLSSSSTLQVSTDGTNWFNLN
jgi:hypothetical protein